MPNIKVIVNPLAGRGYASRISSQISETLTALGARFDLVHTRRAGEAIDLAGGAVSDGFDTIVAVGGDGTSHEVVNGMLANRNGASLPNLGCIPAGSGNDFAVMSGAPVDVREACELIVAGNTRPVDVGLLTIDDHLTRHFDNAVGIGFDGWVTRETYKYKFVRGMALYVPVVLKTIFSTMRPMHVTLDIDGKQTQQTIVMAVMCNGPREGGSFFIAPDARLDDGKLDVATVQWMPRIQLLGMVPRFMKGTHVTDQRVEIRQAERIRVTSDDPLYMHVDGEIICDECHSVEVQVLPAALQVICSETTAISDAL